MACERTAHLVNWKVEPSIVSSPSRSGVFQESTDKRLELFSESISFDHRLYRQDIHGSQVHARMLARQGILTHQEAEAIVVNLAEIQSIIEKGEMPFRTELEDIHMHIEQALIDRLGDVGRKLHTARSRNDQVSTDFRLWIRESIDRVDSLLRDLQRAFLSRCEVDLDVILPAYTHLQRAQPVPAAHYWLPYIEKLARDRQRLADCRKRVNQCPLGAAAVAGTSIDIDRHWTAEQLGFEGVSANSIDISSDRDFAVESVFVLTMIAEHLSGWAEEWILWSTVEFGFLKLPHQFCTGSSIMPQKVNPDTLELTRGKSARVIGNLQSLLVLIKGLPLAYNRDLQEDKPRVFDSFDTVEACFTTGRSNCRRIRPTKGEHRCSTRTGLLGRYNRHGAFHPQRYAPTDGSPSCRSLGRGCDAAKSAFGRADRCRDSIGRSPIGWFFPEVCGAQRAAMAFRSYGSAGRNEVQKQIQRWQNELN